MKRSAWSIKPGHCLGGLRSNTQNAPTSFAIFSLVVIMLSGCTCGNQQVQEHPKPVIIDTPVTVDTVKVLGPEVQAKSLQTPTDTLSKSSKYQQKTAPVKEAPKHNSPDQSKIDSIKKAKEGLRKYN